MRVASLAFQEGAFAEAPRKRTHRTRKSFDVSDPFDCLVFLFSEGSVRYIGQRMPVSPAILADSLAPKLAVWCLAALRAPVVPDRDALLNTLGHLVTQAPAVAHLADRFQASPWDWRH